MRGRAWLCALMVLALALAAPGCSRGDMEPGEYSLYFAVSRGVASGPALVPEPYYVSGQGEEGASPGPGELLEALLAGPREEGHRSPVPRGVALVGWEWDGERPGNLRVRLSEQYGGLTDISLTLADYAIVLTLSQLEGVETVALSSEGRSTSYRSHQILGADEAELPGTPAGREDDT